MNRNFKDLLYFYDVLKSKMITFFVLIICLFLCISTSGCLVATGAPVWYQAAYLSNFAIMGSQAYNMTSGGTLEVKLEDKTLTHEEKNRLSMVETISVLPGGLIKTKFAEALSESGYTVTTPHKVQEFLSSSPNLAMPNYSIMTEKEMVSAASKLSAGLRTDAILIYLEGNLKSKQRNIISSTLGSKPSMETDFQVLLVSAAEEEVLWLQKGTLIIKGVDNFTDRNEMDQVVAIALTQKLLSDADRQ